MAVADMDINTAVAADAGQTETPVVAGTEAAKPKRQKNRPEGGYLYIPTPKNLRDLLDAQAVEQKTSVREIVSRLLAKEFGIELPKPVVRTKYATPEARKTAVKVHRLTKNAMVAKVMEKYAAEMETLQKEIEAEVEAKLAAEALAAAAKAAEAATAQAAEATAPTA